MNFLPRCLVCWERGCKDHLIPPDVMLRIRREIAENHEKRLIRYYGSLEEAARRSKVFRAAVLECSKDFIKEMIKDFELLSESYLRTTTKTLNFKEENEEA